MGSPSGIGVTKPCSLLHWHVFNLKSDSIHVHPTLHEARTVWCSKLQANFLHTPDLKVSFYCGVGKGLWLFHWEEPAVVCTMAKKQAATHLNLIIKSIIKKLLVSPLPDCSCFSVDQLWLQRSKLCKAFDYLFLLVFSGFCPQDSAFPLLLCLR